MVVVRVQREDFDPEAEIRALGLDADVGALASFTGLCRSENGRLAALELEHYPGMCEAALKTTAREAAAQFDLAALAVVHRYGRIEAGERIVLVAAAAAHRGAALDAVAFVMDHLKTDAPFWKKEWPADGTEGRWVEARTADDTARRRWSGPDDERG